RPRLEPYVLMRSLAGYRDLRNEVIDLALVAQGPHQSHRGGFRLCLASELRYPFTALAVLDSVLLIMSVFLFFYIFDHTEIRLPLFAARPHKSVSAFDVNGFPKNRLSLLCIDRRRRNSGHYHHQK